MHHTALCTRALVLTGDPDQAKIAASTLGRTWAQIGNNVEKLQKEGTDTS